MQNDKMKFGRWGEGLAEEYLSDQGYASIGSNIRTEYGEIDLLMSDGTELVFVEVKTRRSDRFGMPEESITTNKMRNMVLSAEAYLQSQNDFASEYRIDVVAIRVIKGKEIEIRHIENVGY